MHNTDEDFGVTVNSDRSLGGFCSFGLYISVERQCVILGLPVTHASRVHTKDA